MCRQYAEYAKLIYNAEEKTLQVIISKVAENDEYKLQKALREYIPAHILIEYIPYQRTHGELRLFTHEELNKFTHQELREKGSLEEFTIEGLLNYYLML